MNTPVSRSSTALALSLFLRTSEPDANSGFA